MIRISFYTPKGLEIQDAYNEITVYDKKNGSFGVLTGHVPVMSVVSYGYIGLKRADKETVYAIKGGVFRMSNDEASVVSEIIVEGPTPDDAMKSLDDTIKARQNSNKERNVELAMAENELKKQIKKTGAGSL